MSARPQSQGPTAAVGNPMLAIPTAIFYIAFAAITGSLSHLTLSPVYGSIPSASQHQQILIWTIALAFLGRDTLMRYLPSKPRGYLPVVAFYVPVAHWIMFRDSDRLGVINGPLATECFAYFPIVLLACLCVSDCLDAFPSYSRALTIQVAVGVVVYTAIFHGELYTTNLLLDLPSKFETLTRYGLDPELLSRVNLQLMTASSAAALSPSIITLLAIPAVIHTTQYNPHFISDSSTIALNQTLHQHKWSIVAREESNTGYVSVLENLQDQFRVLRCDHSLLGGEWLLSDHHRANGITVAEPIYAVFEMLEAVRLVEGPLSTLPDTSKTALVIGLGIGTAPKALLAHGISTTIVELDPIVHKFAIDYFALPTNHTAILSDAVTWVSTAIASQQTYSYILHDVFTGGAEPLSLFTTTFLTSLKSLLTPNGGVIALNYAGDASTSPTKQALHTIAAVFGPANCRVFRDAPLVHNDPESSFTNMVVFCTNTASPSPSPSSASAPPSKKLTFRQPVEADFLRSQSRRQYLLPKAELEMQFPSQEEMDGESVALLTEDSIGGFGAQQVESARRHWGIMRRVAPAVVWENW